jgi:hypothetical protein
MLLNKGVFMKAKRKNLNNFKYINSIQIPTIRHMHERAELNQSGMLVSNNFFTVHHRGYDLEIRLDYENSPSQLTVKEAMPKGKTTCMVYCKIGEGKFMQCSGGTFCPLHVDEAGEAKNMEWIRNSVFHVMEAATSECADQLCALQLVQNKPKAS